MKVLSTIFSLMITASVFAQSGFEGQIQVTALNPEKGETANITWFVKDGQHRLDYNTVAQGDNLSYSLLASNTNAKLLNADGTFIDVPMASLNQGTYDLTGYFTTEESKGQNIGRFACNKYSIQTKNYIVEYWVSNETGLSLSDFPSFMQKGLFMPVSNLQAGSVPVKIQVKDLNGKVLFAQTITGVTATGVDAGIFAQ